MAVRFKFRSSLSFDTVDIEGRPSISVRDLKSKIIQFKNLNLCQDFDLVLSDALTGQEYSNESFQIPDGSSVIIKRVPAESVHASITRPPPITHENIQMKETMKPNPFVSPKIQNLETLDFDDFGVDLYPVPEATLSSSNLDVEKRIWVNIDSSNIGAAARCFEPQVKGCQKLEASDLSDAVAGRPADNGIKGDLFQKKLEPEGQDEMKKLDSVKAQTLPNVNLPSELKCSVCKSFFKEAVMIPCCQHSFCQKCICQVLLEKESCPKCFSTKCGIDDLLPNVSLRQAIEHFLESQILTIDSGNECQRYAPDGESGIQIKDVSCGMSVFQRASDMPHSPSGTGKGSNYIPQSPIKSNPPFKMNAYNHYGSNDTLKSSALLHKMKQIDKSGPGDVVDFDDFQGESQPIHEEAESMVKRKRVWVDNEGGHKSFMEIGKHKKGIRTCYMCGSPDHLIRDCPAAVSPRPMLQTGNAMFPGMMPSSMPYWNGSHVPYMRSFGNFYGNGAMIPFDARNVPSSPFAVPNYMSSMYHPVPAFGRCMGMGGVAPPVRTSENHCVSHSEFLDLQEHENRRRLSNQNYRRELSLADNESGDFNKMHRVGDKEVSYDHKSHTSKEKVLSYSADSSTQGPQRKYYSSNHTDDDHSADEYHQKSSHSLIGGRDQRRSHRPVRLSSEVDDLPCSSGRKGDEGKKHHHESSRKHDTQKEHCSTDISWHCPQSQNKSDIERKRVEYDVKKHNQKNRYLESELKQSTSSDRKKQQKQATQSSKHSRHNSKSNNAESSYERWKMNSGSDEDGSEEYRYYKRKRGH